MSIMKLRRPCEHNRYDDHSVYVTGFPAVDCPGGEFLPEDAANRMHSVLRIWNPDLNDYAVQQCAAELLVALVADQVRGDLVAIGRDVEAWLASEPANDPADEVGEPG